MSHPHAFTHSSIGLRSHKPPTASSSAAADPKPMPTLGPFTTQPTGMMKQMQSCGLPVVEFNPATHCVELGSPMGGPLLPDTFCRLIRWMRIVMSADTICLPEPMQPLSGGASTNAAAKTKAGPISPSPLGFGFAAPLGTASPSKSAPRLIRVLHTIQLNPQPKPCVFTCSVPESVHAALKEGKEGKEGKVDAAAAAVLCAKLSASTKVLAIEPDLVVGETQPIHYRCRLPIAILPTTNNHDVKIEHAQDTPLPANMHPFEGLPVDSIWSSLQAAGLLVPPHQRPAAEKNEDDGGECISREKLPFVLGRSDKALDSATSAESLINAVARLVGQYGYHVRQITNGCHGLTSYYALHLAPPPNPEPTPSKITDTDPTPTPTTIQTSAASSAPSFAGGQKTVKRRASVVSAGQWFPVVAIFPVFTIEADMITTGGSKPNHSHPPLHS